MKDNGGKGYPTVVFMDKDGAVVAQVGGERTPESIAKAGEAAKSYLVQREKAKKGDEAAAIECLLLELDFQTVKTADVRARAAKFKSMSDEQKARLEARLTDLEVW